jgi:CHAT domain-containing protein/tetratricopeptide (TPR) repeat protein
MPLVGGELWIRFLRSHDDDDLDRAIVALRAAADEPGLPGSVQLHALANLGLALTRRFESRGAVEDQDRAIGVYQRVVAAAPPGSEFWSMARINLGGHLHTRHQRTGDPGDLELAIGVLDEVAAAAEVEPGERAEAFSNLGLSLRDRHLRTGSAADLDRAIAAFEAAVADPASITPPQLAGFQVNLGLGYWNRFGRTGDLADLQRAIGLLESAVSTYSVDDETDRAIAANMLGLALGDRYRYLGDPPDLERAMQAHEQAAAAPLKGPQRAAILNNLGGTFLQRHQEAGDLDDLDRGVAAFQESVEASPADAPDRTRHLLNLAQGLQERYRQARAFPDLEQAVDLAEQALGSAPTGSVDRPGALAVLAEAVRVRYQQIGHRSDLERAVASFRAAGQEALGARADVALNSMRRWADWATDRGAWDQAAEAGDRAIAAMHQLFRSQLGRPDKEAWLRLAQGIGVQTAYARAMAGEPAKAVVSLESSRALLLSEALERDRSELEALSRLGHGDLVTRYWQAADHMRELVRSLDVSLPRQAVTSGPVTADPADRSNGTAMVTQQAQTLRAAQAKLDAIVTEIRGIGGFKHFLDVPRIDDIRPAAQAAPLVYVAAAELGGVGFVVRQGQLHEQEDGDAVASIWLPELTSDAVHARVAAFRAAHARRRREPGAWNGTLDVLTAWLWKAAMAPVLDAVGDASAVVLVPVGLLGVLPLHAAWTADSSCPTGRRYVLDQLPISYAPNARSLRASRAAVRQAGAASLLAIREPSPSGLGSLPFTVPEVTAISSHFEDVRTLPGAAATLEEVQVALGEKSVHHFACHGLADLGSPLDSALFLAYDEPLTLRSLLGRRVADQGGEARRVRLAVLSACETQVPGLELPDEVVSLSTGLLEAGVAGVIASQWAVSGAATAILMARFYHHWKRESLEPAFALRSAQCWLRDSTNEQKAAWFEALERPDRDAAQGPNPVALLWQTVARKPPGARDHRHIGAWGAFAHVGA